LIPPIKISQCGANFSAIYDEISAALFQSVLGLPSPQEGSKPFAFLI